VSASEIDRRVISLTPEIDVALLGVTPQDYQASATI
jgi:hypothetical protein